MDTAQQIPSHRGPVIGTLGEFSLHRKLKFHFMSDPLFHEQPVGPYVADIRCGNEIVEIQSRGFYKMKSKLDYFLEQGFQVTMVYPVAVEKWLLWTDPQTGEVLSRRRSSKKGRASDIFQELIHLLPYLKRPGLSFVVVLVKVEELRVLNGRGKNRKKGAAKQERIPLEILQEYRLSAPEDYLAILPSQKALPGPFTVKEYAAAQGCSVSCAGAALRVLRQLGVISYVGKRGRMYEYRWGAQDAGSEITPPFGR